MYLNKYFSAWFKLFLLFLKEEDINLYTEIAAVPQTELYIFAVEGMPRNCNAFGCHIIIIDFC